MAKSRATNNGWKTASTETSRVAHLDLIRVPARGSIDAIVLSSRPIGADTHYYQRQTIKCTGADCPACGDREKPREYWWVAVENPSTYQVYILELTPRAAAPLIRAADAGEDCRGMVITVSRTNKKTNGPQRLHINGRADPAKPIHACPNVIAHLEAIWGAPASTLRIAAEG